MGSGIHPVDLRVGQNLRRVRTTKSVSQSALAAQVGITFQQIQKYEKGTNRISASMMHDIARALEVEITTFFAEIGEPFAGDGSALSAGGRPGHRLDIEIIEKISRLEGDGVKESLIAHLDSLIALQSKSAAGESAGR